MPLLDSSIGSKTQRFDQPELAPGSRISPGPYKAVVKDNRDPKFSGSLSVYVPDFGGDPDDPTSWVTVNYLSPFFGVTPGPWVKDGPHHHKGQTFETVPHSYGMWFVPPDIDVGVLVIFVNGDPYDGYWIGCVPAWPQMHMVPAIGYNPTSSSGTCVAEFNDDEEAATTLPQFRQRQTVPHKFDTAAGKMGMQGRLETQGLNKDPQRGPISSSPFRESPSNTYGISTPGRRLKDPWMNCAGEQPPPVPAKENDYYDTSDEKNGRWNGHSIVMDDGDKDGKDRLIRIRSSMGHQIMMNDEGEFFHVINSEGTAWFEMDKSGNFNFYSAGDFRIHSDRNITLDAKKSVMISAGDSAMIYAKSSTNITGNGGVNIYSLMTVKVTALIGLHLRGMNTYLTGQRCVQVSGGTSLCMTAGCIQLNSAKCSPADAASPASPVKGMPTHEPWSGHLRCNSGSNFVMGSVLAGLSSGLNGVGNTVGNPIGSTPGGQDLLAQINGGGGVNTLQPGAAGTPYTGSSADFYRETYGNILAAAQAKGVPNPEVLAATGAAQAMVETGGGAHMVGNNPFGIKGNGDAGTVYANTREVLNGENVQIQDGFAAYTDRSGAAKGYVDFIANNPRYKDVINATSVPEAAAALQNRGYATDSRYAQAVVNSDATATKSGLKQSDGAQTASYDPRSDLPSENAHEIASNNSTSGSGFNIPGGDNIANDPTKPYNPSSNNEGFAAVKTPLSPEGQAAIDAQQTIIDQARADLKSLPDVAANANVSITTYTAIMGQLYQKIEDAQSTINVLKENNGVIPEAGSVRPLNITPIGPIGPIVPIGPIKPPEPTVTPDNNAIIRVDAGDTLAGLQFAGLYSKNTASDAGWQYGSNSNNTAPIYTAGGDPRLSAYSSNFLESVANRTAPTWTTVNGASYRTDSIISPSDAAAEVSRRLSSGSFSITSPGGDPALSAYSDAALRSVVNGNAPSATQTFFGDRGSPVATPTTKVIDPITAQRELDARGVPSEPVSTDIVTTPDPNFSRTDNTPFPWNLTGYQRDSVPNVTADQPSLFQRLYGGSPAPTITDQPFNPENPNFVQSDRGTATNPNNDGSTAPAPATTPNNPPNIQDAIDASIAADNPGTPAPPDTSSNSGPAQPVTGTGGTGGGPTSPPGNSVPMSLSGPAC